MRATRFLAPPAAACLALLAAAWLPSGHAADDHMHGPAARPAQAAISAKPAGQLVPMYPPTKPYSSAAFFPTSARAERERYVTLYDNYFSPSLLWVPARTKVTFLNRGRHHHTITCNWLWESGDLPRGEWFSLIFTRTGTYSYHCRHHDYWMKGTITVY
jgi:plastocyanin